MAFHGEFSIFDFGFRFMKPQTLFFYECFFKCLLILLPSFLFIRGTFLKILSLVAVFKTRFYGTFLNITLFCLVKIINNALF